MAKKEKADNLPVFTKEKFIEAGLAQMQINENDLKALAEKSKDLTIAGLDDEEGFESVKRHRLELRDKRTEITKKGKDMRDISNAYNKAVLEKEKTLLAIIVPEEDRLKEMEDRIQEQKDQIEQQKQNERKEIANERLRQLTAFGFSMDYDEALNVTEETFQDTLTTARESFEREEARKKEAAEKLEKQKQAQEQEAARQAEIKAEQDRKAKELDERDKKIREQEREIVRKEMEALQSSRMQRLTPYLSESVTQDISKLWEWSEKDFEIYLNNRKVRKQKEDEEKLAAQNRKAEKDKAAALKKAEDDKALALAKAEEDKQAAIKAEQDRILDERYASRSIKLTSIGFESPGLSLKYTHPEAPLEISKEYLRQITEEAFDTFIIQSNSKLQFLAEQKRILADQAKSDKEKMLQFGEELSALKEKYEGQFKSQKHILLFAQFAGEISRAVKTINIQA